MAYFIRVLEGDRPLKHIVVPDGATRATISTDNVREELKRLHPRAQFTVINEWWNQSTARPTFHFCYRAMEGVQVYTVQGYAAGGKPAYELPMSYPEAVEMMADNWRILERDSAPQSAALASLGWLPRMYGVEGDYMASDIRERVAAMRKEDPGRPVPHHGSGGGNPA